MKIGRHDPKHPGSSKQMIMSNECLTDPS